MELWRYAGVDDPFFGYGSYWALTRSFAERFARWNALSAVQRHLDGRTGSGPRRLYTTTIELDYRVADLRMQSLDLELTPAEVEALSPRMVDQGIRWVIWYEGVWEGTREAQALYLGSEQLEARPVES